MTVYIGVAAYSGEPGREAVEATNAFIEELSRTCRGERTVVVTGGYWGLMKHVVDKAIAEKLQPLILPPLEREDEAYPEEAIIVKTGASYRLRSIFLVRTSDVLVVLGGAAGTIQEAVTAYTERKTVILLLTGMPSDKLAELAPWIDERKLAEIHVTHDPRETARKACQYAKREKKKPTI